MTRWVWLGLLLVAAAAFALRWPQLSLRPMHTDEAVHAIKFGDLWEKGTYRYDPSEYHGPTLYYATLPVAALSRAGDFAHLSESTLRMVPLLFGLGLILLLPLLHETLGRGALLCASLFTAVSPAFVFYSRYYIHELMLVFFTLLLLGGAWRYHQTGKLVWAVLAGAGLGLLAATKETFVISMAAFGVSAVLTLAWNRWVSGQPASLGHAPESISEHSEGRVARVPNHWNSLRRIELAKLFLPRLTDSKTPSAVGPLLAGLAAALAVSVVLFSSFFTNLSGPFDAIRTYLPWFNRAAGQSPHIHPWYFYFERLFLFHRGGGPVASEALILVLAAVGFVAALTRRGLADGSTRFVRFLGFYTLALTAAYSLISYKTPWCALSFLHGMILLAGVGVMVLMGICRPWWMRYGVALLLALGTLQLAWQAWRASFVFYEDRRNPYVYAQTLSDILDLTGTVESVARLHPQGCQMPVEVAAPNNDFWPLPWYLRGFKQVGWYGNVTTNQPADVLIVSPKFKTAVTELFGPTYQAVGLFGLRPGAYLQLYVRADLWRDYLQKAQASARSTQ